MKKHSWSSLEFITLGRSFKGICFESVWFFLSSLKIGKNHYIYQLKVEEGSDQERRIELKEIESPNCRGVLDDKRSEKREPKLRKIPEEEIGLKPRKGKAILMLKRI